MGLAWAARVYSAPMPYETLLFDLPAGSLIARVTLNRPERLNAINRACMAEILAACEEIQARDEIWAVIWTGAGRGFCSGADIGGPLPAGEEDLPLNTILDEESWVSGSRFGGDIDHARPAVIVEVGKIAHRSISRGMISTRLHGRVRASS